MGNVGIKKTYIVIWSMMIATLVYRIISIGGHQPQMSKVILAASLWLSFFLFPSQYIRQNDFGSSIDKLLRIIIILTAIATVRSVFAPLEGHVANKWFTLFGNQECMFMLLAPCLMYLCQYRDSVLILKYATQLFLLVGTVPIFLGHYAAGGILFFSAILYPHMKRGYQILIYISIVMSIVGAFFVDETSRSGIILLVIIIVAYICVYVVNNKKLIWVVCLFLIIAPLAYSVLMLINPAFSVIDIILNWLLQQTGDEQLATDSRSFLFWEIADDLTKNEAWLLGKGALSHYFSAFFFQSTSEKADVANRIGVEVTLLMLLLRSGVAYAITYYSIIVIAVTSALRKARNKFVLSVAVMAAGWSLFSCVSYLNGCNFLHLGFFLLLGCCASKRWQNYTDEEIKCLLKG